MDAHVTDDTVAVFHESTPTAGMHEFVVGAHRRRARPHFVIEVIRRGGIRRILPRAHMVIATNFDDADFAQLAFFDYGVPGFNQMGCATALSSDLNDAIMLAGCREHCLTF